MMFGFWIILVILAFFFFREYQHDYSPGYHRNDNPLEILRERYARGEIDSTEFNERKRTLGQ